MRQLVKYGVFGVFMALVVLVSGCRTPAPARAVQEGPSVPFGTISAQQLAQRLGMAVAEDTPAMVTLRSATASVVLLPDPAGQAYVNGMRVGAQGGFLRVRGVLFVPATLEADIRAALAPPREPSYQARGPRPRPAPGLRGPLARAYRIVVDPGHGGKDPGTISRAGLQEKSITLPVATELARLLRHDGFEVIMTRRTDTFVELDERAAIANRFNADLFVSIHADACPDPEMRGFTVYTSRDPSSGSRDAAEAVVGSLRATSAEGLGMRQANYRVLVVTECPAILVELGYLSNGLDAEMLADHAVQEQLARAIADGIDEYFTR